MITSGEAEEGEIGPGQIFAPFLAMEDLLDKLKLLNYEKELVLKMRMRPLNRQADPDDKLISQPDKKYSGTTS